MRPFWILMLLCVLTEVGHARTVRRIRHSGIRIPEIMTGYKSSRLFALEGTPQYRDVATTTTSSYNFPFSSYSPEENPDSNPPPERVNFFQGLMGVVVGVIYLFVLVGLCLTISLFMVICAFLVEHYGSLEGLNHALPHDSRPASPTPSPPPPPIQEQPRRSNGGVVRFYAQEQQVCMDPYPGDGEKV